MLHIVQQHRGPALVKLGRLIHRGVEPADGRPLLAQGVRHTFEQVRLAAAAGAPQVGGHGGAGGCRACITRPQLQVAQRGLVRPCKKPGQCGVCGQTDIECELLHGQGVKYMRAVGRETVAESVGIEPRKIWANSSLTAPAAQPPLAQPTPRVLKTSLNTR